MRPTRAGAERRRPGHAAPEAQILPRSPQAHAPLAVLQRQVGNRAVAALVEKATAPRVDAAGAPPIQRSATTDLGAWNAGTPPGQTYTFGVDAWTDDIVGHAWIHVKENGGKGRSQTIGFWPTAWGVLPTGGPGELRAPDTHAGQQGHRSNDVIDRPAFLRVLNVVNAWEGSWYQILYRNCAHFAKAASAAADKYTLSNAIETDGPTIWTPGEEGDVLDAANKARGRNAQGEPLASN